jgi:transposase
MRKIREVLRLKQEQGLSNREVATACNIGAATVHDYLRRASLCGLSWPQAGDLADDVIEERLFPTRPAPPPGGHPMPDLAYVARELRRKGVTLALLWEEYRQAHPDGYGRSRYCQIYAEYAGKLDPRMRQVHKAGEKLFVDYAGQTIPVVDPPTGEIREAQVFVATLGASDYTFSEATWSQTLEDWTGSHARAFSFFGGVPEIVVPDNLKTGITSPCYYEPDINPTYAELAEHYGVAIIPARVVKPRDKGKVENHVLNVERRILAPLRNRRFLSLWECNQAIAELLAVLNDRPFQQMPGTRRSLFLELDAPALRPLPAHPYCFGLWKKARVNIDYHVSFDQSFYSVPYTLLKEQVDVRSSEKIVEIFFKSQRIASHVRSCKAGVYVTDPSHMPKSHQAYLEWTPERLVRWAAESGGAVALVVEQILSRRVHPQQGFRSCLGVMRLSTKYGPDRLEAACARTLQIGSPCYGTVKNILQNNLDQAEIAAAANPGHRAPSHANIRGAAYYQSALSFEVQNET